MVNMVLLFYFLSLFLIIQSSNMFSFWLFIELNIIILFYFLMKYEEKKISPDFFSKYFIIQTIISLSIFLLLLVSSNMNIMFILMMMKFSVPPFEMWLFGLMKNMIPLQFFLIIMLQKIPLFFLLFTFLSEKMFLSGIFFIFFSFIMYNIIISFFCSNIMQIFFFSSINSSFFSIMMLFFYKNYIIFYLLCYCLMLISISFSLQYSYLNKMSQEYNNFIPLFIFLNFMSVPPFNFFFFKMWILGVFLNFSFFFSIVVVVSSFLWTFIYSRFLILSMKELVVKENVFMMSVFLSLCCVNSFEIFL